MGRSDLHVSRVPSATRLVRPRLRWGADWVKFVRPSPGRTLPCDRIREVACPAESHTMQQTNPTLRQANVTERWPGLPHRWACAEIGLQIVQVLRVRQEPAPRRDRGPSLLAVDSHPG